MKPEELLYAKTHEWVAVANEAGQKVAAQGRRVALIIADVCDKHPRSKRQRAMSGGKPVWSGSFAAGGAVAIGHHSNVILVFGLNLLYYALKLKKIPTGPPLAPTGSPGMSAKMSLTGGKRKWRG